MRRHKIEYMRLDDFISAYHPDNPKDHDLGALDVSFDTFDFVEPPTIDETTGFVIAGHGRGKQLFNQMKDKNEPPDGIYKDHDGMWLLPVVRGVEFEDEAHVKSYLIASNQTTILGGWNDDDLVSLLQTLHEEDENLLNATGFDSDDLDDLAYQLNPTFDPDDEWVDMPEFEQDGIKPFHSIIVHFNSQADIDDFAELLDQTVTDKTKFIYYPKQERNARLQHEVHDES